MIIECKYTTFFFQKRPCVICKFNVIKYCLLVENIIGFKSVFFYYSVDDYESYLRNVNIKNHESTCRLELNVGDTTYDGITLLAYEVSQDNNVCSMNVIDSNAKIFRAHVGLIIARMFVIANKEVNDHLNGKTSNINDKQPITTNDVLLNSHECGV